MLFYWGHSKGFMVRSYSLCLAGLKPMSPPPRTRNISRQPLPADIALAVLILCICLSLTTRLFHSLVSHLRTYYSHTFFFVDMKNGLGIKCTKRLCTINPKYKPDFLPYLLHWQFDLNNYFSAGREYKDGNMPTDITLPYEIEQMSELEKLLVWNYFDVSRCDHNRFCFYNL